MWTGAEAQTGEHAERTERNRRQANARRAAAATATAHRQVTGRQAEEKAGGGHAEEGEDEEEAKGQRRRQGASKKALIRPPLSHLPLRKFHGFAADLHGGNELLSERGVELDIKLGRYPTESGARTVVARPPSGSTRRAPRAGEWDPARAPRQRRGSLWGERAATPVRPLAFRAAI
jgi:hypothetical protein